MKYSIITSSYNSQRFIERLLTTVLFQSYPNYEWIVQDGGSTDGTLDILKKYPDARIKLCSEPDCGIYDAWNKAVARATGDWAIFLGSDDMFIDADVLAKCHRHIKRMDKETQFAYAAVVRGVAGGEGKFEARQLDNFSLYEVYCRFNHRLGPPMPGTFIRTALLKHTPFAAEKYKIAGDFDFVARFATGGNIARIPVLAVYQEMGGISTDPANWCLMSEEICRVLHERIAPKAEELTAACMNHYYDRDNHLEN